MKHLTLLIAVFFSLGIASAPVSVASAAAPLILPAEEEPLSAEAQQQIRNWVKEGTVASAKSDWEGAHAALSKAWELKPLPMIAANLGYVEIKMGRYREAAEHLQYFLGNAPTDHPERQAEAEQQLAECRKHIAVVNVSTDVAGARVALDSLVIGQTPLRRQIFLNPGTYTIEVTHSGYQPDQRVTTVQVGSDLDLEFKLVAEPVVASPPAPPVKTIAIAVQPVVAERPRVQPRTWALIGGSAATALSLGIGIGYRLRVNSFDSEANSTNDKLDSLAVTPSKNPCANPTGDAQSLCAQLKSTWGQRDTAVNVSTGCFVAAGVLGVATAVSYLLWPAKKSKPRQLAKTAIGVAPLTLGKMQGFQFYTTF